MSERENSSSKVHAASGSVRRVVPNMLRRWILALAALVALVFAQAGPCGAQSQSTAPKSATAGAATPTVVAAASLAPTSQVTTPNPVARQASAKAISTGIRVHGHWTIEVKNPDGSLVRHVEFENAIVPAPGFAFPIGPFGLSGTLTIPGGEATLSGVLTGQVAPAAGSWAILLTGEALSNLSTTGTTTSPCQFDINVPNSFGKMDACILTQSGGAFFNGGVCGPGGSTGLSCNLAASPIGTAPNFSGFQLSGNITASQPGQIVTVATLNFGLCGSLPAGNAVGPNCSFFASDGIASLTSSNNFTGAPVTISAAGQSVSVTVQITFQ